MWIGYNIYICSLDSKNSGKIERKLVSVVKVSYYKFNI